MKRSLLVTILFLCLVFTYGCSSSLIENSFYNESTVIANNTAIIDEIVTVSTEENFEKQVKSVYSIERKDGISSEDTKYIEQTILKIYEYFNANEIPIDDVTYIMATFSKIENEKDRIFFDYQNISTFEIVQLMLRYTYSDYLNYGLMYGIIYNLAHTYNLEFEETLLFSLDELTLYWDYMIIGYWNFRADIVSEEEVEIAKYVSKELVEYIQNEYGNQYLVQAMKNSSNPEYANEIPELLEEWINKNNPHFSSDRIEVSEIFNQNSPVNKIEFQANEAVWVIHLDNEERNNDTLPSIYESSMIFHQYMQDLYDEIARLERVFDCDVESFPTP